MNRTKIDWCEYVWKKIPGFDNYRVSRAGLILSLHKKIPKILKPISKQTGYQYVFLYQDRRCTKKYVHDLVLLAFVGTPREGQECRHLDGNPTNNTLANLRWGTKQENALDRRRHHTVPEGEKTGTHKLTENDVKEIRKIHGRISLRRLGHIFGISHTAIRRAALGITWSCINEGLKNG